MALLLLATGVCLAESDQNLTNKALFDFVTERSREFGAFSAGSDMADSRRMEFAIYDSRTGDRRSMNAICAVVTSKKRSTSVRRSALAIAQKNI